MTVVSRVTVESLYHQMRIFTNIECSEARTIKKWWNLWEAVMKTPFTCEGCSCCQAQKWVTSVLYDRQDHRQRLIMYRTRYVTLCLLHVGGNPVFCWWSSFDSFKWQFTNEDESWVCFKAWYTIIRHTEIDVMLCHIQRYEPDKIWSGRWIKRAKQQNRIKRRKWDLEG